jgi:hypothetical protein
MTARRFLHPFMISVQADSHIVDLAQQLQDGPLMIESLANRKTREAIDPRSSTLSNFSASFTDGVDMCFKIAEGEDLVAEEDISVLEPFALEFGFGEYVPLVCAGVLQLAVRDSLKPLGIRAALIRARCLDNPGKMAAIVCLFQRLLNVLNSKCPRMLNWLASMATTLSRWRGHQMTLLFVASAE